MSQPFLFVALDDLTKEERKTLEIAERLSQEKGPFGFKVNLDYLLYRGLGGLTAAVREVQQFDRPVFADLKMWNGTRTMRTIIEMLVALGVNYFNVYALADNLLPGAIQATEGSNTKALGVTVLTHFDEVYCQKWFRRSLRETVRLTAEVALERGCHGIVLPGTALDVVQDLNTDKVVPGVRPKEYPKDARHAQEVTPQEAVQGGANILVCGGPIMKDSYPEVALRRRLIEMGG